MSTVVDSHDALHNVMIILDRALHFPTPDGSDSEVSPGRYRVDIGADGHLHLASPDSSHHPARPLRTFNVWHQLTLTSPLTVTVPDESGAQHIAMLLPGGTALQSTGSPHRQEKHAHPPKFVTPADLAEAILKWTPPPHWPTVKYPFDRLSVLKATGTRQLWGTIEPGSHPSVFVPGNVPPTWISATVAVCYAAPGATCSAPGTPESRNIADQLFSLVPVTVKSLLSWAGKTVDLLVTSQVVSPGGYARYMTWTDLYRMVPGSNGPVTFQNVIAASALVYNAFPISVGKTRGEEAAYILTSPSGRGAPISFELQVNGITQARRSCEYLGHFPGGSPELRCA